MISKNESQYNQTDKIIQDCYIQLLREGKTSIKVLDIVKRCEINKSTFYRHFKNTDILKTSIQDKAISDILHEGPNLKNVYTNTRATLIEYVYLFRKYSSYLMLIFDNSVKDVIALVEEKMLTTNLLKDLSEKEKAEVHYAIGGISHLLVQSLSEKNIAEAIRITEKIILNN